MGNMGYTGAGRLEVRVRAARTETRPPRAVPEGQRGRPEGGGSR